MAKSDRGRSGGSGNPVVSAAKHQTSNMTTAARPSPATQTTAAAAAATQAQVSIHRSNGETKKRKKNKKMKKRKRQDDNSAHSDTNTRRDSAPLSPDSSPSSAQRPPPPPPPTTSKKQPRIKEKPARFAHPHLDAELRRLHRSWLSPGDPLFNAALERSYKGMRHEPADSLPEAVHRRFRQSFDSLHEAGLFLYDTVQAGGKRLSRTFVTRTLVGDAGITYKYLGLRLFAHPWDLDASDFRKGPGDGLANELNDPCLSDLFSGSGGSDSSSGGGGRGSGSAKDSTRKPSGSSDDDIKVADTLRKLGGLSEWMRLRAVALLKEESKDGGTGGGAGGEGGSCAFNLTLINRMECTGSKRDLKPDPLFSMGKCSVSWHADSCLQDFSTIGVYHCTDPVPAKPDWGIALRVSKEENEGAGDGGSGREAGGGKARRGDAERGRKPGPNAVASKATPATAAESVTEQQEQVSTPPLLVPLQSGDAYFLLDDFNHFHEHAVVSGSSTLRYSSTHRVADTDGNTFSHVQKRCEEALAGGGGATESHQILNLVQVREEQALLTELESEWLNQFWVQGRRHAILHPWWRGPMALVLATWKELERRTALAVQHLMSLRKGGPGLGDRGCGNLGTPAAIAKTFETVLRALEERRESRSRWEARFVDPAYRPLSSDCSPVVPALWPAAGGQKNGDHGGGGAGDGEGALLPQLLDGVILRLRECYTIVYRAASGGKKAASAKAIAAGAASNWELFRAASPSSGGDAGKRHGSLKKKQQQQPRQHDVAGGNGQKKRKRHVRSVAAVSMDGGDEGRRAPNCKGSKDGREKGRIQTN